MDAIFAPANDPVAALLDDLTDALEILYSCRRMEVQVSDQFLDYIDHLIDQIEAGRLDGIARA